MSILNSVLGALVGTDDIKNPNPADESSASMGIAKTVDSEGVPIEPSAYEVEGIWILKEKEGNLGGKGNTAEIYKDWQIVTSFEIVEDLYNPFFTCRLFITDSKGFFSLFGPTGREKIKISLRRIFIDGQIEGPNNGVLDIEFYVTSIEGFKKSTEDIDQMTYQIIAISNYAYVSSLKKICRSVKEPVADAIEKILKDDLGIAPENMDLAKPVGGDNPWPMLSFLKGIITVKEPINAVKWLCLQGYDSKNAPFYCFSRISDQIIRLWSWSWINDPTNESNLVKPNALTDEYEYKPGHLNEAKDTTDPKTVLEMQSKIIAVTTPGGLNMSMNPRSLAKNGTYGSKVRTKDYLLKDYIERLYVQEDETEPELQYVNPLEPRPAVVKVSKVFSFLGVSFSVIGSWFTGLKNLFNTNVAEELTSIESVAEQCIIETDLPIPVNEEPLTSSYGEEPRTAPMIRYATAAQKTAYRQILVTDKLDLYMYGDLRLNPGCIIKLKFPAPEKREGEGDSGLDRDPRLSGEYIIMKSTHVFESGKYFTSLSVSRNLMPSF